MFTVEISYFLGYSAAVLLSASLMVFLAFLFAPADAHLDKLSPYECGFHPFEHARKEFDIHFYLVALLFVAFDLEILLLLPWALSMTASDPFAVWAVIGFVALITIGFVYEWSCGTLDW